MSRSIENMSEQEIKKEMAMIENNFHIASNKEEIEVRYALLIAELEKRSK